MIRIEQKTIKNKPFYYLTERFNTGKGFKKIQVYIGKNVPKDVSSCYETLKQREKELFELHTPNISDDLNEVTKEALVRLERYAFDWKYYIHQRTEKEKEQLFLRFAIQFIYESNGIEGSQLTQDEVSKLVHSKYKKTTTYTKDKQEVFNAIKAFQFIRSGDFRLNQKNIKQLYRIITENLGYETDFKKNNNHVNNKNTIPHERVKEELQSAIVWYTKNKKTGNPFMNAIVFHNRFEHIHPFLDGNGRTGRMILVWMLIQSGYDIILFKKSNMRMYFSALDQGDEGRYQKLITYAVESYKKTIEEFTQSTK